VRCRLCLSFKGLNDCGSLARGHSISRNADGVYEGVAIGGDRYPGTTFIDHLRRYQANPDVKMMVVLGEVCLFPAVVRVCFSLLCASADRVCEQVGGVEEYEICKAIDQKVLTKPLVAWCIGTCAKIFPYEVRTLYLLSSLLFLRSLCAVSGAIRPRWCLRARPGGDRRRQEQGAQNAR
jgi:hypothetical protein